MSVVIRTDHEGNGVASMQVLEIAIGQSRIMEKHIVWRVFRLNETEAVREPQFAVGISSVPGVPKLSGPARTARPARI
jgi:hypothetical protein